MKQAYLIITLTLCVALTSNISAQDSQNATIQTASYQLAPEPSPKSSDQFPSLEVDSSARESKTTSADNNTVPMVTVGFSLLIVLSLFGGLVWLSRRYGGGATGQGSIPNGVLESLGSTALDARTRVSLLRCGSRIVLVAQTANGIQPLCEISDPQEVQSLLAACNGEEIAADALSGIKQTSPQRKRLFATA